MKTSILFCFLLSSITLFSQTIVWEKAFNKSKYDRFGCVRATSDDGCIWGGVYHSRYLSDTIVSDKDVLSKKGLEIRVVKLTALGETEWDNTYGDTCENEFNDIKQTRDGGYILLGSKFYRISKSGGHTYCNDAWVLKINSVGKVEWAKDFTQLQGFKDISIIQQTNDDGFLLASEKDTHVFKIDSKGDIQWRRIIKIPNFNRIECVCPDPDGGYILGGLTSSSNRISRSTGQRIGMNFLIKINVKGRIQKKKIYADLDGFGIRDIQPSADGGYLIGGGGQQPDRSADFCLLKINSRMQLQWRKYYGGSKVDIFWNMISNLDGTFVLAGSTNSLDGDVKSGYRGKGDFWLVKINAQGDKLWEKTFGSSMDERFGNAQRAFDGCYYLGGTTGHFTGPLDGDIDSRYPKEKTTESMESDVKSRTNSKRLNAWIVKVKE